MQREKFNEEKKKEKKEEVKDRVKDSTDLKILKTYKTSFKVMTSCFGSFNENSQYLSVGLSDGSIIVLDIGLGIEKYNLNKHPMAVSTLTYMDDKFLISGSVDGSVHFYDLENEGTNKFKCNNHQDHQIPIVKVGTSPTGIAIAFDMQSNIRLYDVYRNRKIAKISPQIKTSDESFEFRILPTVCLQMHKDVLIAVSHSESQLLEIRKEKLKEVEEKLKAKKLLREQEGEEASDPIEEEKEIIENSQKGVILEQKQGELQCVENLRNKIEYSEFKMGKSNIFIYRLEDVLLSLFPQISSHTRQGMNFLTVFKNCDPHKLRKKSLLSNDNRDISGINSTLPFKYEISSIKGSSGNIKI